MGLPAPNTFPIPDVVVDEWLAKLTGAELKVLLYILRRTLGFRKRQDAIGYSQFLKGIVTAEGHRLDYGAGVSHASLRSALKHLQELGLIEAQTRQTDKGDNDVTLYTIAWEVEQKPLYPSQKLAQGRAKILGGVEQKLLTQETDSQETEIQETRTPLIRAADAISAKLKRRYRVDEIAHWLDRLGFDEDDEDLPRRVNTVLLGVDRKMSLQEIQEQLERIHG